MAAVWRHVTDVIGLQTPAGRLVFFLLASAAIFLAPYDWLSHLSLWQHLGIPSPSIGLTRAYHLLLHGDPIAAWQRNRLIYLVLLIGVPLLARDVILLIRSRKA